MSFGHSTCTKQKNVAGVKAAPGIAGDTWTWAALDADSKLIISHFVGSRDWDTTRASLALSPFRRRGTRLREAPPAPLGHGERGRWLKEMGMAALK